MSCLSCKPCDVHQHEVLAAVLAKTLPIGQQVCFFESVTAISLDYLVGPRCKSEPRDKGRLNPSEERRT
jgi:hypothetical protein